MNKENSQITTEDRNDCNTVLVAGWISIETQMPPLNENVLVFDDFHRMNICKRMDDIGEISGEDLTRIQNELNKFVRKE